MDLGIVDQSNPVGSLQGALAVLSRGNHETDMKMAALRFLQGYVGDKRNKVDASLRANINQLVLDNVLGIVLGEDRVPDLRRRQLLRTECFLILGTLLGSNTLFGGIHERLDEIDEANVNESDVVVEEIEETETSLELSDHDIDMMGSADETKDNMPTGLANGEAIAGPITPNKKKRGQPVTLKNPIHDGSPSKSPHGKKARRSGGFKEQKSPESSPIKALGPPGRGTRPPIGPPGGWVRASSASELPPSPTNTKEALFDDDITSMEGTSLTIGRAESLSSDLAYSKSTPELGAITQALMKPPRKLKLPKSLKPRPSGFLGGQYETDGFAPGVKNTDWFEQDRRLGYQKPRMWFPLPPGGELEGPMVPRERNDHGGIQPDDVVTEFQQMKAMLSYVSDMILLPYSNKTKKLTRTERGKESLRMDGTSEQFKPFRRLAGVLGHGSYEQACQEAMELWSPLVGAHLPGWAKARVYNPETSKAGQSVTLLDISKSNSDPNAQYASSKKLGDVYGERPMPVAPWEPSPEKPLPTTGLNIRPSPSKTSGGRLEKRVLYTREVLRSLLSEGNLKRERTKKTFNQIMNELNHAEGGLDKKRVEALQNRMTSALDDEQAVVQRELQQMNELMKRTVDVQYATFPDRFKLLLEGEKANPRQLLQRMCYLYCRTRSRNWLALTFGVWKARMVIEKSRELQPLYARRAACHLMREWAISRKFRQMKKQVSTWRNNVARIIFTERNKAALPFQTLYRKYRDRCLILRLHVMGPYKGPLSDIELGEWRKDVKFRIPRVIRDTRREIWYGVVKIQTLYRKWIVYRHTLKRRRQVVLLQSVIRMFPKREIFKRLRRHVIRMQAYARRTIAVRKYAFMKIKCIIMQKYVRRYLKALWKWRVFERAWRITEKRLGAAILIQCRWREYACKQRIARIIKNRQERDWACLVLQRRWFKKKNAFHTFVLMCCLRAAERDDEEFNKYVWSLGRYYASRLIQRLYKERFFKRNISASVKIQCKYRGYHGYNLMEKLRREKWASRRLHHWARGVQRRKERRVRTIQRAWWNYKKGGMLRHFEHRAKLEDDRQDRELLLKKHAAASVIQAFALGKLARTWVIQTKAALKIQKNSRFFLARLGWRKLQQIRNRTVVKHYIESIVSTMLQRRVRLLLAKHSKLAVKPQALVRGFLLRCKWRRSTEAAHKYAKAVLTIQRAFRASGAMAQAVAEVMAKKREADNPFRQCASLHRLLEMCYAKASSFFSVKDPRVGLKIDSFLYRLGLGYLEDMFPAREFQTFADLQHAEFDIPTLQEMYEEWQERETKRQLQLGNRDKRMVPPIPYKHFNALLDALEPKLVPTGPTDKVKAQKLLVYAENSFMTPKEAAKTTETRFIKKFGLSQTQRGVNLGAKVAQLSWFGYCNFRMIGEVLTPAMIDRALEDCETGPEVAPKLEFLRTAYSKDQAVNEAKWDKKRIALCADNFQLAAEAMHAMLLDKHDEDNPDPIFLMLESCMSQVLHYRKRFRVHKDKMIKEDKVMPTERMKHSYKGVDFKWAVDESSEDKLSAINSVDLPFNGNMADFDNEENISVCKLYMETFDKLRTLSSGIQGLKNKWFVYTVRRAIKKARVDRKLTAAFDEYMAHKHANHVHDHWRKFKALDAVTRKFRKRQKELEEKRRLVAEVLQNILVWGWEERVDDQGYAYYEDVAGRGKEPTYEPPRYDMNAWFAISMLQKKTRVLLERLHERARRKEEARLAEMARIEALWMEEIEKGKRGARVTIKWKPVDIEALVRRSVASAAAREAEERARAASREAAAEAAKGGVKGAKAGKSGGLLESKGLKEGANADKTVDPTMFAKGSADVATSESKGASEEKSDLLDTGGKVSASSYISNGEDKKADDDPHAVSHFEAHLEGHIPWKLRFEHNPVLVPGMWALLRTKLPEQAKKPPKLDPTWKRKPRPVTGDGEDGSRPSTGATRKLGTGASTTGAGSRAATGNLSHDGVEETPKKKKKQGYGRYSKENSQMRREEHMRLEEERLAAALQASNPYLVKSQGYSYEAVVVFRFRKADPRKPKSVDNMLCDTRTYKGTRTEGVRLNRICVMNLDVNSRVECRYQKHTVFYPGKILSIHESQDMRQMHYTVCYDDGEVEHKMTRDYMRPPAKEMSRWFHERGAHLTSAKMFALRQNHYHKMRVERINGIKERSWYQYQGLLENMPPGHGLEDAYEPLSDDEEDFKGMVDTRAPAEEYFGGDRDMSRASAKEKKISSQKKAGADGGVAMVRSPSSRGRASAKGRKGREAPTAVVAVQSDVVSSESEEAVRHEKLFKRRVEYMIEQDKWLQRREAEQKVSVVFTRLPYQYGWHEVRERRPKKQKKGYKGPPEFEDIVFFRNRHTREKQDAPPNFRPQHDFAARKLQKNWAVRRARMYLRRLLASEPLEHIVENAVQRYQKIASIGFKEEGVTVMMKIRRYGFFAVADIVEDTLKYRPAELEAITAEGLANTPTTLLERLGFAGMEKLKSFKEFSAWYKKTTPLTREKSAQLMNYYVDVDDTRSLREIIDTGLESIKERFIKQFPKGASRTTQVIQQMVTASMYPHTSAMVENYIKRYSSKAERARENINELKDKKTTHSWVEEAEAFTILWGATRRLRSLISNLGLGTVRRQIIEAEEQAQAIMDTSEPPRVKVAIPGSEVRGLKGKPNTPAKMEKKRVLCSGPEARAALVLRVKVFDYLEKVFRAVLLIQKRIRGFNKYSSINKELARRRKGILIMQRTMRGCMDRMIARDLRNQQASEWEQLWDSNRELVYYYNRTAGKSTYMEPQGGYRPLVRDRLSQALVQAWPFLDTLRGSAQTSEAASAIPNGVTEVAPYLSMCSVCEVRKCVRLCMDCKPKMKAAPVKTTLNKPTLVPYCFPCYTLEHSTDETENHRFQDASENHKKEGILMCASCTVLPATRKCLGILDDKQIDDLCAQLQRTVPRKWPELLQASNVGGERKLSLMLEQIRGSSSSVDGSGSGLSMSQLQQVRVLLERTRAECDECYCDDCYIEVHSGGRRSTHKWIGFQENAQVCGVCVRSPAEVICKDCDNHGYCKPCFKVFHAMGRKRKHRNVPLMEQAEFGQDYCGMCTRRVATVVCPNIIRTNDEPRCNRRLCNSCHTCHHAPVCDPLAHELAAKVAYRQAKSDGTALDPNHVEEGAEVCCICGEEADQQCVECGDLYCSRTWMGNPGCWITHHSKGNRANHRTISLEELKSISSASAPPAGGYAAWA